MKGKDTMTPWPLRWHLEGPSF